MIGEFNLDVKGVQKIKYNKVLRIGLSAIIVRINYTCYNKGIERMGK
jgi:hypothetical protein